MRKESFDKSYHFCSGDKRAKLSVKKVGSRGGSAAGRRKCPKCDATSAPDRKNCWVCNSALPAGDVIVEDGTSWFMKFEVDGRIYRTTDDNLNASIRQLFEDFVAGNFKQNAFAAWVNRERMRVESARGTASVSASHITETYDLKSVLTLIGWVVCVGSIILAMYMFWADLRVKP